jgi:PKD repeat protein
VAVGQSSTQTFTIVNAGIQTLTGSATAGAPFAIVSGSPFTINGGKTGLVSVSFNPVAAGAFTGSVFFTSNGGASTNAVTGSGAIPPIAGFTGSPTNGAAALLVNFTDASTGTVTGRVWTFGDGGASALTSPSHSYVTAGTFSVSLTVLGPLGSNAQTRANYITVTNVFVALVANFTASPLSGVKPLLVNFLDASTGTITNHLWNFGDGNTSAAVSPSHTYSNANVYSVSLTVLGPGGSSSTNRANLITVTNAVNIPPTVTILRPGNSMLYPPVTNLTITVVASATSNDGAPISKIEFFEDATKLAETNANPATFLLLNPTLGVHVLSVRASDTFGETNISSGVTITIGAKNSPLGDWQVTISGADKGAEFLTLEDDYSASGFGIRNKTFGLDDVSGHWSFNAKGQVMGPYLEEIGSTTNWTGTLLGTFKSLKTLTATVPTASGIFHWKGIPATTFPDLSGTWTGLVTVVKTNMTVSYAITNNVADSAVFDIATSADPATVVGQLLVTSRNSVYGYVTFDSKQINFSGTFSASRLSLTLKGIDATAEKVSIKIFK